MAILGSLLGRSRSVRSSLLPLLELRSAASTLRSGYGLAPTGSGTVCFVAIGRPGAGTEAEIIAGIAGDSVRRNVVTHDAHGRTIVRCWRENGDLGWLLDDLVDVNDRLAQAGFASWLLYSTVDFAELRDVRHPKLTMVYRRERGTFYPYAPRGTRGRDRATELKIRSSLTRIVPMEADIGRWHPV
ncbi:PspA-associated protein PspAB [Amycolatopsis sp. cmx-11-32]|uniref:PspA-associated protein PspAB n=1 Tax=Amycolatopsis sp. cmx-11-32 TaxID=2785796 RepID=UPI0039E38E40